MTTTPDGLKIYNLQASNVLNLEFINIATNGDSVTLYGDNGAGKSSVLDSIRFALSGRDLGAVAEPVRHGEQSGDIVLDLGDMVIKRHFTNNSSTLIVENKDGMRYKTPQAILDGFRGNVSFDPMQFAGLPEKQQREILLGLIDLPIDLDELAEQRKAIYDARTHINRDVKQLEGQIAGIVVVDVPAEEISAVGVMEQMQAATETIANNKSFRENLLKEKDAMEELVIKGGELKLEISRIQKKIDEKNELIPVLKIDADKLVDPDLEQFKCQLEDVELINAGVRKMRERAQLHDRLTELKGKSLGMTVDMTAIDELKTKTIQEANMPVDGLGFAEMGVTFEGIPLSQRSSGELRMISAAIGMALNPKLKVLWVKDASLLDSDSLEDLKELAKKHGYQLWLEIVGDSEEVGIHIKDGGVV